MAIQAQNRATFYRIQDGKTANFMIETTHGGTQIKSKDPVSFLPDYTKTPQYFKPILNMSGKNGNQILKTCTWKADGVPIVSGQHGFTIETSGEYRLKLAQNLSKPTMKITCEYTYTDAATGKNSTYTAEFPSSVVENAGTMIMAQIVPKDALMFSTIEGAPKNLRFEGRMIRGGAEDTTNVEYRWHIQGTNGNFFPIVAATAPAGSGLPSGNLFTNWTSKEIVISSNAILNIGMLKLVCKDTDGSSTTYNKTAEAALSIVDLTDPIDIYLDYKDGPGITEGSGTGNRLELIVRQGLKPVTEGFYNGKSLGLYRETASSQKDATWAPAASEFSGWSINGGVVRRTYSTSNLGTAANRTVTIKESHLRADSPNTSFMTFIDF